ncbi:HAD family hydrolase [Bacillus sp. T33-2]|uniref:HAD family hydrolase n=1 Tax=Bacillus sp. T33-2 TaxID=2054168 RepID=UPI000C76FC47|nr:HAD family hydrolase [Bacillus sp. T33-2]PLR99490.1 HAD family hydrolase [Bacillus sp. T33-2]
MTENKKLQNEMYYMVQQFHSAFKHPVSDRPTALSVQTALNRGVWTGEEIIESLYATVEGDEEEFSKVYDLFLSGLDKAFNKMITEKKPVSDKVVAQADALTDQLYFIFGSFVQMGITPFELFEIVQQANMGKLHNGVPKYRESDGKIMKPENWERDFAPEPRLAAEIKRQSEGQ